MPDPDAAVVETVEVAATALGLPLLPLEAAPDPALLPEPELEPEPELLDPPPPPPECVVEPELHPASGSQYCWSPAPVARAAAGLISVAVSEVVRISLRSFDIGASMTNATRPLRTLPLPPAVPGPRRVRWRAARKAPFCRILCKGRNGGRAVLRWLSAVAENAVAAALRGRARPPPSPPSIVSASARPHPSTSRRRPLPRPTARPADPRRDRRRSGDHRRRPHADERRGPPEPDRRQPLGGRLAARTGRDREREHRQHRGRARRGPGAARQPPEPVERP